MYNLASQWAFLDFLGFARLIEFHLFPIYLILGTYICRVEPTVKNCPARDCRFFSVRVHRSMWLCVVSPMVYLAYFQIMIVCTNGIGSRTIESLPDQWLEAKAKKIDRFRRPLDRLTEFVLLKSQLETGASFFFGLSRFTENGAINVLVLPFSPLIPIVYRVSGVAGLWFPLILSLLCTSNGFVVNVTFFRVLCGRLI